MTESSSTLSPPVCDIVSLIELCTNTAVEKQCEIALRNDLVEGDKRNISANNSVFKPALRVILIDILNESTKLIQMLQGKSVNIFVHSAQRYFRVKTIIL